MYYSYKVTQQQIQQSVTDSQINEHISRHTLHTWHCFL